MGLRIFGNVVYTGKYRCRCRFPLDDVLSLIFDAISRKVIGVAMRRLPPDLRILGSRAPVAMSYHTFVSEMRFIDDFPC
jgi:hypothetical protein